MAFDDEDEEYSAEFSEEQLEEALDELGHVLEEEYVGDDRFELVDLMTPGPAEGEDFRLRLTVEGGAHFFVAVLAEEQLVRVGLAVEDEDLAEEIEESALESGGTLTDFLAEAMDESELDYEVQHYEDEEFYFASEIPLETEQELASEELRETIIDYLDGYIEAFLPILGGEEEEEE